jgi:hypothetical protein
MEQKDNTGAIFKNDFKKTEQQPDYKGTCTVDGKQKEIALWINESKTGVTYFGAQFTNPYKNEGTEEQSNTVKPSKTKKLDGDLPF